MAAGTPTITWDQRGPKKPGGLRGLKMGTGVITLSANSTFNTSIIEKSFRRCKNIQVQVEAGFVVNWTASATHKAGLLTSYALSSLTSQTEFGVTSGQLRSTAMAVGTVGTFTAFGV